MRTVENVARDVSGAPNHRRLPLSFFIAAGAIGTWCAIRMLRSAFAYDFRDKTVLITGGSRGLGLVLAREAALRGGRPVICARDSEGLQAAHDDLQRRGADVVSIPCDLTDPVQVKLLVAETVRLRSRIDVVINNAGTITVGPYETMTLADFDEAMNTNYWAALHTIHAVVPVMRSQGAGRIVNITSIGGKVSIPHLLPYAASKFALVGLSEGLRAELRRYGIIVTTVVPGLMRTGSPRNAIFKGKHRAEYAWFSVSDALPVLTLSAERAARQVLDACARGDAEVILSISAKLAAMFHGVFPGLTSDILAWVNRLLPAPGGIGQARALGKESESAAAPSFLTALGDRAAEQNNEMIDDRVDLEVHS